MAGELAGGGEGGTGSGHHPKGRVHPWQMTCGALATLYTALSAA